ncbi:ECF transporter S component [Ureaplasma parvum]|uniref:ECF transporter S component n=1 Tax=Ureaplasma parvum TaxID=134821 RepID=UPI00017220CC|nr:ECF transporter S component [Ureaplasma parvum]ASD24354.1 ECF transporter S component [Ureaplasma parvum]ASD29610.1 ECF transporter S component [Ureaplasma parvum]EDT48789.1 putative membrane protein [Ureaplasma parvum serovar 1 str. ATCC 27813]EDU19401.1 putative membrane protein [Ureaplasma parvum serovar 6 str. ATCC 27818]QDI64313.1 ECF transporter S component [Ureaplasma parvum]
MNSRFKFNYDINNKLALSFTKDLIANKKQKIKKKFLLFLFPFYPLKLFKTINLIVVFAVLVAIRLGMGFLHIKIPGFNMVISFTWMALMVLGWYFGPLIGIFAGFLVDTLAWLISGGIWFWMYAIQEPIVGFIAGFLGSVATLRKKTKRPIIDLIVNQIFILFFSILTLFMILTLVNDGKNSLFSILKKRDKEINEDWISIFKYLAIAFLATFVLLVEAFVIIYYLRNRNRSKVQLINFIYCSLLVIFSTMLFSFALGPYVSVAYLKYIKVPITNYLKYGVNYYLLPRIIKESIKTPIYIILLSSIISAFDYVFLNIKQINMHKWKH